MSTDLGTEGGLGLIINFASTMIMCELDDIIFNSSSIHSLKEKFDEIANAPVSYEEVSSMDSDANNETATNPGLNPLNQA